MTDTEPQWHPIEHLALPLYRMHDITDIELGVERKDGTVKRMGFIDCVFRHPTHWRFRW